MKRGIVYLRISTDRQSNHSIAGQQMMVQGWCDRNDVQVVDVFKDEGFSARNFDRPDFKRLYSFIEKHYRTVDHLVVFAFDRFSRDAGEAIVAIKKLQRQFAIKVVSVSEGITFDADDPGSFFYAGLMLLKGEDEIIRNKVRINMGIYTAKKKHGRYLGAAPFGYRNEKDENRKPIIVPDPETAEIVRIIYQQFLMNVPIYLIRKEVSKIGFNLRGNSAVHRILQNPVYCGLLHVKAYREYPEELIKGIHEPIIDDVTWQQVQDRFKPQRPHIQVSDDLPLRGVLKCHCGIHLTGAASRGKGGNYYYYYKCKVKGHNNIPAKKAHAQFDRVLEGLNLPLKTTKSIELISLQMFDEKMKSERQLLKIRKSDYEEVQKKLRSVEEKWINNQMSHETYSRWHSDLTKQSLALKTQIEKFSGNQDKLSQLFKRELSKLAELKQLYAKATTPQKHELVRMVFDNQLYYEKGSYRTPYVLPILESNSLKTKQLQELILDKKGESITAFPSSGDGGSRTLVQNRENLRLLHAYP